MAIKDILLNRSYWSISGDRVYYRKQFIDKWLREARYWLWYAFKATAVERKMLISPNQFSKKFIEPAVKDMFSVNLKDLPCPKSEYVDYESFL